MQKNFEFISKKALASEPISESEALYLFQEADLLQVMRLANELNLRINDKRVFYNVNRHINPTNICVLSCRFCSFSRKTGDEGAFALSRKELQNRAVDAYKRGATEVHLVGGLHPRWRYADMLGVVSAVKEVAPDLHIKAYTAVEIDWMARRGRKPVSKVLEDLKEAGLASLPGGGAEIFHPEVRAQICETKVDAERWLEIHRLAHRAGLRSNATMLYGSIETHAHRVDHMQRLRVLQNETEGFNVFIPLAFQPVGNAMGIDTYTEASDDLKTIAVARIFLHNFRNIKAYWVMLSRDVAQLALIGGANDFDGTIEDEKISHMAGGRAGKATSKQDILSAIAAVERQAVERTSLYQPLAKPTEIVTTNDLLALGETLSSRNLQGGVISDLSANTALHRLVLPAIAGDTNISAFFAEYFAKHSSTEEGVLLAPHTTMDFATFLSACGHCRLALGVEKYVAVARDTLPVTPRGDAVSLTKMSPLLSFWGVSYLC